MIIKPVALYRQSCGLNLEYRIFRPSPSIVPAGVLGFWGVGVLGEEKLSCRSCGAGMGHASVVGSGRRGISTPADRVSTLGTGGDCVSAVGRFRTFEGPMVLSRAVSAGLRGILFGIEDVATLRDV